MSAFETQGKHIVAINVAIEQMSKGQDQAYCGTFVDESTGETGQWGMITDGHGSNTCIHYLRRITQKELNKAMGTASPAETLADMINMFSNVWSRECSGATLCAVKVYKDRIVCINVGDSLAAVYKNGALVFVTEEHNSLNEKEKARLSTHNPSIKYYISHKIRVTSDKTMYSEPCEYIHHSPYITLVLSQAIGHCGVTGCAPDTTTIPYGPEDTVRIIIGSDGFWDMIAKNEPDEMAKLYDMTSEELIKFGLERWLQPWNMHTDAEKTQYDTYKYEREQCDDLSVVKIDIVSN